MDRVIVDYPNNGWTKEVLDSWNKAFYTKKSIVELDLSRTEFVNLFDWLTIVAMMEKVLANANVTSFRIDSKGSDSANFIPLSDYIHIERKEYPKKFYHQSEISLSKRIYQTVGFIESLGTLDILNRQRENVKIYYPGISIEDVKNHQFYSGKTDEPSVILGLTAIRTKEDCRQFLDDNNIRNWVRTMGKRFTESPLFESEEIWRVLCHEFAANIFEHCRMAGFISARVVTPRDRQGRIRQWCKQTFPYDYMNRLFHVKSGPFLELCIGDAGIGIVESLNESYLKRLRKNTTLVAETDLKKHIRNEDILAYAFDELGTSKDDSECWITERHALNRILNITAKYGGVLTLRSGGLELIYSGEGEMFEKKKAGIGYPPTGIRKMPHILPGAQFQILLPLVPLNSIKSRPSVLALALPSNFRVDYDHVRGHLIPLLEKLDQPNPCVGKEEQRRFRKACENLGKELYDRRPSTDPLILDFSQLNWTASQFETLLYYLQNILPHRPVLLVEIETQLTDDVDRLESMAAPTSLDSQLLYRHRKDGKPYYDEVMEKHYLETYSRIHSTVIGIDQKGNKRIFGLRNHAYKAPLLSLIDDPKTIKDLINQTVWGEELKENTLNAILNHINPMFQQAEDGKWRTVWDSQALSNELQRVMSHHFDEVAQKNRAWRGYPYEKEKGKYKLPWESEWRPNFLESTRILSRERHADEVAQRLIYRLEKGMEIMGKSLADVKVLACVTAPGMLLANFIHRWWPPQYDRPALSDLGYYVMLSHPKELPSIVKSGGIVIVHDILDRGAISGKLSDVLQKQDLDILCLLSFIKLEPNLKKTEVAPIDKGWTWTPETGENKDGYLPKHSMIWVKRPETCPPPTDEESDKNTFWIEPRTLRPVRYRSLRRQFELGKDKDLDRRNRYLERFDRSVEGCLFAAGHYVYGSRHYTVSVDIQKTLNGEIGDEIALWLADICESPKGRRSQEWENEEGKKLKGDITAVLMPLHSQIHYVWPKVEKILAQRGRRQLSWLLDATLFAGSGPSYRIPIQFRKQITEAVEEAVKAYKTGKSKQFKKPIRILIIDDAMATTRTAGTILVRITRIVRDAFKQFGIVDDLHKYPSPIEWIRYFCLLNQMSQTLHSLWKNFKSVSEPNIKFVFEAYAPFMGVAVYSDNDCPTCRDIERLKRLSTICDQYGFELAREWTEIRVDELKAIAIDSPGFDSSSSKHLKRGIEILKRKPNDDMETLSSFFQVHAATAIWRFYELMYYSYPPGDILSSLNDAWGTDEDGPGEKKEYERYRWAVLEWCLRNWKRLEANAAIDDFILAAKKEIDNNSFLVHALLEGCAQHAKVPQISNLIVYCIDKLAELEGKRTSGYDGMESERIQRTTTLFTALTLFWLDIPPSQWTKLTCTASEAEAPIPLINYLDRVAQNVSPHDLCFLKNLHCQLKRPQRHTDPQWALDTIAETLLRGRDPKSSKHGRHHLLPKLIAEIFAGVSDNEDRLLLHSNLTLFLAALDDVLHYDYELSSDTYQVKGLAPAVFKWLKHDADCKEGSIIPQELRDLQEALDLDGPFIKEFNRIFHEEVGKLKKSLERKVEKMGQNRLSFEYRVDEDTQNCRMLIHGQRLRICLANLTIDPIANLKTKHKSRIEISRVQEGEDKEKIAFRLLTNFASIEDTRRLTRQGQNIKVDKYRLEAFGVEFAPEWQEPSPQEISEGFTATYIIKIPSGFMPRRSS